MIPKTKRYFLVLLFTLPFDLVTWPIVVFIRLLWGKNLHWSGLVLQCEFKFDSWPMRTFYKNVIGTCLCHAAVFRPGASKKLKTIRHEQHHVEQFEASFVASFLFGLYAYLTGHFWFHCFWIWFCGAVFFYCAASVVALIRGEHIYFGNVFEEGAYAVENDEDEN